MSTMVFGWGQDPDPEKAQKARERYERGVSLLEAGNREAALDAFTQAAEAAGQAHTSEGYETRAEAMMETARLLDDDGSRIQAFESALDAAKKAETDEGRRLEARAGLGLGRAMADLQAHDEAAPVLERASEQAREADAGLLAARTHYQLARVADARGNTQEAVDHAREAAERAAGLDEAGADAVGARAHLEVGRVLRGEARFAESVEALERAERIAESLDGPEAVWLTALARTHAGRTEQDAGRRADAKANLQAAVEAGEEGDARAKRVAAIAAWHLAEIHSERGEGERAASWFETAYEHALEAPQPEGAALAGRIQMARAHHHYQRGEEDAASEAYAEAARVGEEADSAAAGKIAQEARSRNVQLASGLDRGLEVPSPPDPEPAPLPLYPPSREHDTPPPAEEEPAAQTPEAAGGPPPGEASEPVEQVQPTAGSANGSPEPPEPDASEVPATADAGSEEEQAPTQSAEQDPAERDPVEEEPAQETGQQAADEGPDEEPAQQAPEPTPDPDPEPDPEPAAEVDPGEGPELPDLEAPPDEASGRAASRGALVDRAETLRELALARDDEDRLLDAIEAIEAALEADPRDPDLLHRRASLRATLAVWRDDADALEQALNTFHQAFQEHGGRVDPTTHQPGPNFFFDWGAATYQLARRRDAEHYEAAYERLETGYEMTPRGARHLVAAAQMARCRFGLAEAQGDPDAYEAVVDRYRQLEEEAGFALEAEDHATWARALHRLADQLEDPELAREAYRRMETAYERS